MIAGLGVLVMVLAALLGAVGGAVASLVASGGGSTGSSSPSRVVASPRPPEPGTVADVAARVLPSVVTVSVRAGAGSGGGSGFVFSSDGYIVTNSHVIDSALADDDARVTVVLHDGRRLPAEIVGRNASYDVAVLRVDDRELPAVELGAAEDLRVGDSVLAIGAPLGLTGTVTSGIVSALERPVTIAATSFISAVQTDAAVNPGNSGGPLLDGDGKVVGVTTAIATLRGEGDSSVGSIGLGFAVPVEAVARIAAELIETGASTTPIVGVVLDQEFTGVGARVASLTPGGPAEAAGVRPGDVIVAVDGRPTPTVERFVVAIRSNEPGDVVTLDVRRGAVLSQVEVRLTGERLD